MNEKQKEAFDIAVAGHNLYVGGPAGTGKSFLIRAIEECLRKENKNVYVTCTTGIACANFNNAMTVHRWSGIDDGRYTSKEVTTLIKETPRHKETLSRILNTDTLIIDEISMLSEKLFLQLESICSIKNPDMHFGGIQVILCGDFRQLPPVPNVHYNDEGNFCFSSDIFTKSITHRVILTDIIRQNEGVFIRAIQEVSEGSELSEDTADLITSCQRPLPDGPPSVKLFSTNNLVDDYNRRCVLEWRGELVEYSSKDQGDQKFISKITAPQKLWLKEGCPVVLLRNLTSTLYNGLQGHVVSLDEDGPIVDFGPLGRHRIAKVNFTVYSPITKSNICERMQYPLKLAFALSIHKAQGMTLERVEVDCRNIFKAGQLGVAMGRVRSIAGLRILNFKPDVCIQQPEIIQKFIDSPSRELDKTLNCCQTVRETSINWQSIFGSDDEEDDSFIIDGDIGCEAERETEEIDEVEFDDDFNKVILSEGVFSGDGLSNYTLPSSFDPQALLHSLRLEHEMMPIQTETNELLGMLMNHLPRVSEFCKKQFVVFSAFLEDLNVTAATPVKSDILCRFYERCNQHQTSQEYLLTTMILFQDMPIYTDAQAHICYKLTVEVRKYLLQEKVDLYQPTGKSNYQRFVTSASKARIRYVGGYCISKVRYRHVQIQRSTATKVSTEGQEKYDESTVVINILDSLRVNEAVLQKHSTLQDTLVDVVTKQNSSKGLTHIKDELFLFFMNLCEACLSNLTDEHLHRHGQQLYTQCITTILDNTKYYEEFLNAVQSVPTETFSLRVEECEGDAAVGMIMSKLTLTVSVIECVYKAIVQKFVMVMFNQYRKDLLQAFSVEKTLAHRKQILIRKSKQEDRQGSIHFESIQKDESLAKEMSHNLLKGLLLQKKDVLKSYTKANLQTLCRAYSLKITKGYTKAKLMKDLTGRILSFDAMPNPQFIQNEAAGICNTPEVEETIPPLELSEVEPQPGTSSASVPFVESEGGPSTDAEKDVGMEQEEVCKVCGKVGRTRYWICCESCSKWLHRNCAGLRSKKKWDNARQEGTSFLCDDCI